MADDATDNAVNTIELATELTIAWLGNPNVRVNADEVPEFLKKMHETLGELGDTSGGGVTEAAPEYEPAVPVRTSVKPDYIVSLITGQKLKSLKRHLASHGLSPQEYRERYGLKPDYPMVSANYSAQRRKVAQDLGLGRKGRAARAGAIEAAPAAVPKGAASTPAKAAAKPARKAPVKAAAKPAPAKRGRPKKAYAPAA